MNARQTITIMALGLSLSGALGIPRALAASPTATPKPTPTLNPTQAANRLARAKQVATDLAVKRQRDLKNVTKTLRGYKGNMLAEDYAELEGLISKMELMLAEWKSSVAAATTVDQVKSIASGQVLKTRYYLVFKPDFNLLVKIMVMKKSHAQIQKRITTYEQSLAKKRNNTKNNAYENATNRLNAIKERMQGMQDKLAALRTAVYALTPDKANGNREEFNAALRQARADVNGTKGKLTGTFKQLNELKELLSSIGNLKPTPAN